MSDVILPTSEQQVRGITLPTVSGLGDLPIGPTKDAVVDLNVDEASTPRLHPFVPFTPLGNCLA